ncbi:hypothetical protein [Neobacillus dielmonensis]|uniref:hypothetical protein n=1 Tax=Neobacillus dielmonensis TaxID=1347369 RepID=UPI0005AA2A84|nr:hypothetical protein [Neobacillus dielmonensis]
MSVDKRLVRAGINLFPAGKYVNFAGNLRQKAGKIKNSSIYRTLRPSDQNKINMTLPGHGLAFLLAAKGDVPVIGRNRLIKGGTAPVLIDFVPVNFELCR